MTGSWEVDVNTNGAPQKVASALGKLSEQLIGAEYTEVAYLGKQIVNGVNHAVLAEQLLTTGKDTKNLVMLIFNEKPKAAEAILVNIERVIEGGAELGGAKIDVQTDVPEDAKAAFDSILEDFIGSKLEPVALLATKVEKGTSYAFLTKVTPVVPEPVERVAIVTVNPVTKEVTFTDLLTKTQSGGLGYAFTW